MTGTRPPRRPGLAIYARLSPIGVDDWAQVRSLHIASFLSLVGTGLDLDLVEATRQAFMIPEYTEELMQESVWGAWLDGHLIGTCGWRPADDNGLQARVTALFVDPLFTRNGVGRSLLADAEARAGAAGFAVVTTRATAHSVGFFEACGYEVSSHGVHVICERRDLPVTFLRKALAQPAARAG
jgi:GNAT superfamily N-acetyltransferase